MQLVNSMMFLEVIQECSSADLQIFMQVVKKILSLIHIIAPIVLMISLFINFTKLVKNPDDKKLLPKVRNSAIAAVVIFFIPTIVDAVMAMVSNSNTISACWNETIEYNYKTPSYVEPNNNSDKKNILQNPDDYQKGQPQNNNSGSSNNNNSNNNSNSSNNNSNNNSNSSSSNGNANLNTSPGTVRGDVEIHFINPNSRVDAIYIRVGNESIFIDGGFKNDGKREIEYLVKLGVTKIDYYIGTHSHKDHVEAAPPVIQKFNIKKVLVGRETCNGSGSTYCTWYAIKGYASDQKVSLDGVNATALSPGDVFYLGGLKITCLGPIEVTNGLGKGETKQNYNSLVLRLDYGSTSFMLTGDNSASSTIKKINSTYPGMLNVDVLKNAHHNGCTSDSIYQMYNAEHVVFTTRNDYLPSNSCINTIKKYGAKYYYIVANGYSESVLFTSDGTNIKAYEHYNK